MDEKLEMTGADFTETEPSAAPASEQPVRKKKKKRPVDGAAAEQRAASSGQSAASGETRPKKKKKRPVEGAAAEQRTASTSARSAASGEMRPKRNRPTHAPAAERRMASQERYRAPIQQTASRRAPESRSRQRAVAAEKTTSTRFLSTGMFLIFIAIYVVIFLLLMLSINKKANKYLAEFESSRPKYAIESYLETLDENFLADMMTQATTGLNFSAYEKPEMLYESARSQVGELGEFTYQPAEDFTESQPIYYVLQDGEAIAKVPLARSGWTEKYNFPEWRVDTPISVISLQASPEFTLTVTMPEGATMKVNGVEVPEDQYLETESEFLLTPTELYFMQQPMARKCVIGGLYCAPKVTVMDADGNVLEPYETPSPDLASQEYIFPIANDPNPDQGLVDRVTALTKAYMDYVINTRCEVNQNLAVLSNYMLAGSPFSNLMYTIASDIWYNNDPNMREDHVFEVKNVRYYADNVCMVDVRLESTIGKVAVNDYACTVRWVLVNTGYGWYATNFSLHQ